MFFLRKRGQYRIKQNQPEKGEYRIKQNQPEKGVTMHSQYKKSCHTEFCNFLLSECFHFFEWLLFVVISLAVYFRSSFFVCFVFDVVVVVAICSPDLLILFVLSKVSEQTKIITVL